MDMTPEEFIMWTEKLLKRLGEPTGKVKAVYVYTTNEAYHITSKGVERYK